MQGNDCSRMHESPPSRRGEHHLYACARRSTRSFAVRMRRAHDREPDAVDVVDQQDLPKFDSGDTGQGVQDEGTLGCSRSVAPAAQSRLRRALDRNRRHQHRLVDVHRRGGLADDGPQRRSIDGLSRAGLVEPADVPSRAPGRCSRRCRGQAAPADLGRECHRRHLCGFRRPRVARPHHARHVVALHTRARRGCGRRRSRMAVHRSSSGHAKGRTTGGCRAQQRGREHQPRHRAGIGRHAHSRSRGLGAFLDQCGQQYRQRRRIAVVATASADRAVDCPRSASMLRSEQARAMPVTTRCCVRRCSGRSASSCSRARTGRSCPSLRARRSAAGPTLYGLLLGAIGAGAVGGALALPRLTAILGPNGLLLAATIGTAAALGLFGLAREPWTAFAGERPGRDVLDRCGLQPQRVGSIRVA